MSFKVQFGLNLELCCREELTVKKKKMEKKKKGTKTIGVRAEMHEHLKNGTKTIGVRAEMHEHLTIIILIILKSYSERLKALSI